MKLISTITLFLTLPWFCFAQDDKQTVPSDKTVILSTIFQKQDIPNTSLSWHRYKEDWNMWYLFDGTKQVGALYPRASHPFGNYRERVGNGWSNLKEPPGHIPLPIRDIENFGVEFQKIHEDNRVTVNGQEVPITRLLPTRSTQQQGQQLLDDSHFSFVTFICGDEQTRNKVRKSWETDPRFAQERKNMHFNALPLTTPKGPHHTARLFQTERDPRFAAAGGAFYIQGPAGENGKAKAVGIFSTSMDDLHKYLPAARREVDPNFDPTKVPDAAKPNLLPFDATKLYEFWTAYKTYILIIAIAAILWWRNK